MESAAEKCLKLEKENERLSMDNSRLTDLLTTISKTNEGLIKSIEGQLSLEKSKNSELQKENEELRKKLSEVNQNDQLDGVTNCELINKIIGRTCPCEKRDCVIPKDLTETELTEFIYGLPDAIDCGKVKEGKRNCPFECKNFRAGAKYITINNLKIHFRNGNCHKDIHRMIRKESSKIVPKLVIKLKRKKRVCRKRVAKKSRMDKRFVETTDSDSVNEATESQSIEASDDETESESEQRDSSSKKMSDNDTDKIDSNEQNISEDFRHTSESSLPVRKPVANARKNRKKYSNEESKNDGQNLSESFGTSTDTQDSNEQINEQGLSPSSSSTLSQLGSKQLARSARKSTASKQLPGLIYLWFNDGDSTIDDVNEKSFTNHALDHFQKLQIKVGSPIMYRWIELPKMRATVKRGKDRVAKILGRTKGINRFLCELEISSKIIEKPLCEIHEADQLLIELVAKECTKETLIYIDGNEEYYKKFPKYHPWSRVLNERGISFFDRAIDTIENYEGVE